MPDTPTEIEQIQQLQKNSAESLEVVKSLGVSVGDLATKFEEQSGKFKKDFDGIYTAGLKQVTDDLTSSLQSKQDAKLLQEQIDKRLDEVQNIMLEIPTGKAKKEIDIVKAYKHELVAYMRANKYQNQAIDKEVLNAYITKMVGNCTYGAKPEATKQIIKSFVEGSDPSGGYWIMPERLTMIIDRDFETSPLRPLANIQTTSRDSVNLIIDDEELDDGGWVGEVRTTPITDNTDIGLLTIPIHKLVARPEATEDVIEDVQFDLGSYILGKADRKFTRKTNTAFVVGDGSKKPKGFLKLPAWSGLTYERGKLQQVVSGSAAALTSSGLIKLKSAQHEIHQPRSVFVMKRDTFGDIMNLTISTTDLRPLINFNLLKEGAPEILLGKPVIFMDDMEAVGNNNLAVAYADFSVGYTIVDRRGIRVIRDEITKASQGLVVYNMTIRLGGAVTNFDSIKIQKISA